jgi:hypothetical protein
MWCSTCQQDVPGIAHSASGRVVCSRCQQPLRGNSPPHAAAICDQGIPLDVPAAAQAASLPPKIDDWSSRRQVRRLDRELRRPTAPHARPLENVGGGRRRFDPPTNLFDEPPAVNTAISAYVPRRSAGGQFVSWLVIFAGAAVLFAGLGLLSWSLAAGRADAWNLAVGLTLGGQGVLILGLVLVVSRLWRNGRYATGKLQEVHKELGQLQRTADALAGQRPSAGAFYEGLARGSSPAMLLANLKGQVDQLAIRLGG